MPKAGLSLMGFMEPAQALFHLKTACVPDPAATDASLLAEFEAARVRLGVPESNAGNPEILPLPEEARSHIDALMGEPWAAAILNSMPGWSAQLIEIDPLISFQITVLNETSQNHTGSLSNPTAIDLLPICLPLSQPAGEFMQSPHPITPGSQSVIIKTRDLNLRMMSRGVFDLNINGSQTFIGGMAFHYGSPFVFVGRYNGRCYLANGYHRATGIRRAGATHIPCIFRDVTSPGELGIANDGSTFALGKLESNDPPTVRHFALDRAHQVALRMVSRVLHISWSEYVLPDE